MGLTRLPTVMQVELDACSYSFGSVCYLVDDSHVSDYQRVLSSESRGVTVRCRTKYLFGAFGQKHASSTIEGKRGTMNTITQAHLEGRYVHAHRNQEGAKTHPETPEKLIEDTALHNPLPHLLYNLQGGSRIKF